MRRRKELQVEWTNKRPEVDVIQFKKKKEEGQWGHIIYHGEGQDKVLWGREGRELFQGIFSKVSV